MSSAGVAYWVSAFVYGRGRCHTAANGQPLGTQSALVGHDRSIIDRNLNKISIVINFVIRHARVVSYLGIALTLALAGTALCLRPDDRLANALPAGSETAASHGASR